MSYVRLDKIKSSAHIETFVHNEDLKNGQFVKVGKILEEHGGEAVEVKKAASDAEAKAIVTTVHGVYQNGKDFDITKEVTKAGKAGRAHVIETGNVISFLVPNDKAKEFKAGDNVGIGDDGLGIKKADSGEGIGQVQAVEFQPNVGDLVVVRFK